MNLICLLGHDFGEWQLRPPLIGARVEWLYWQRDCRRTMTDRKGRVHRCGAIQQRWFRVRVPTWAKIPAGVKQAIPVANYLERIRATAPDPESLRDGRAPTKQQLGI